MRFGTIFKCLLVIVFGIPLLSYLLLVAINFNDEVKSETVIGFETFLSEKLTVEDSRNGFVYAAGLTASVEDDFYKTGINRILAVNNNDYSNDSLSKEIALDTAKASEDIYKLVSPCGMPERFNDACNDHLLAKTEEIDAVLANNSVLLQRYKILISQTHWYESVRYDLYQSTLLGPWSTTQKLLMLEVWREASKGNKAASVALLQQDNAFWQNAMGSTHYLINLMVMSAMVKQNYQWGELAFKNLNQAEITQADLKVWLTGFNEFPFSFNKVIKGEWQVANSSFSEIYRQDEWWLIFVKPIFNSQSTNNLYAERLIDAAQIEQVSEASNDITAKCSQDWSFSLLTWYAYNPIGKLIVCSGNLDLMHSYGNELAQVEALRLALQKSLQAN